MLRKIIISFFISIFIVAPFFTKNTQAIISCEKDFCVCIMNCHNDDPTKCDDPDVAFIVEMTGPDSTLINCNFDCETKKSECEKKKGICQDINGKLYTENEIVACTTIDPNYTEVNYTTYEAICKSDGWDISGCNNDCQDIHGKWHKDEENVDCATADSNYTGDSEAICEKSFTENTTHWNLSKCEPIAPANTTTTSPTTPGINQPDSAQVSAAASSDQPSNDNSSDSPKAVQTTTTTSPTKSRQESLLGLGFEEITGFGEKASNENIENRDEDFTEGGLKTINSVFYNIKNYFKYIAGSVAILYILVAATQIVTATGDEGIQKGKKNLKWSIVGLVTIFAIDVIVVTFFEGGKLGTPGESLFEVNNAGLVTENTELFKSIAKYFKENARVFFNYLKTIAGAFAILFIFLAGTHMISAGGNEEKIEKEKKFLMHAITAFVTLLMLDTMIFGFIYPDDKSGISDPICTEFMNLTEGTIKNETHSINLSEQKYNEKIIATNYGITEEEAKRRILNCKTASELGIIGSNQILGIVRFFESLIGGIAIFFIVYSGVSIISSMGNEEQVTKHKKSLLWGLAGLAIIVLAHSLVNYFFFTVNTTTGAASVDTTAGITTLAGVVNFIASFVGVFSVISIIIAGIIWVTNFGNTEIAEKAKKIIIGAIAGVILSVSAYAIVNSITAGNPEGLSGNIINIGVPK